MRLHPNFERFATRLDGDVPLATPTSALRTLIAQRARAGAPLSSQPTFLSSLKRIERVARLMA
ncbi:MAG: hypothetical protein AAGI01_18930, partial [Myxococcota bacterium]